MNFQLRETLLFISFPLLIMLTLTVLKRLPAGAVWETSVSSKPRVGDITQVRGQTIRHPLVSALCRGFSLSPVFPKLSQRVGTMKLSCVTPTQQQWLLSFCSQSTAISVASASVFVCGGDTHTHTHTRTHTFGNVCVSCEGVSRSERDETERKSHKTSQKRRIWAQEVKAAKKKKNVIGGRIVSFPQTIIKNCSPAMLRLKFEKH